MTNTLGIDVSRYEGVLDWKKARAAGYRFAIMRATVGDYYTDPTFSANWAAAKKAGLFVSAYHVVVATRYGQKQIDHFYSVLDGRKSDFPLALDIERDDNVSNAANTACIRDCLKYLSRHDSRKPLIYTAYYYWKDHVLPSSDWGQYPLWVASYNKKPLIPPGWTNWKFWQYSENGKISGITSSLDVNQFNGSYDDLVKFAGHKPQNATTSNALQAQVVAPTINVRNGPGTTNQITGSLAVGKIINIINLSGKDVWVELKPGQWASCISGGNPFMKLLPGAKPSDGIKASVLVDRLNIRSEPSIASAATGVLKKGDVIRITAINGKDVWVEFDKNQWAAFNYSSGRLMQMV